MSGEVLNSIFQIIKQLSHKLCLCNRLWPNSNKLFKTYAPL